MSRADPIVGLGSDHAGFELKEYIKQKLKNMKIDFVDYGTNSTKKVDYPDYGKLVAKDVAKGKLDKGILFCGSGIGMNIVANKIKGIRAASCYDLYTAKASRSHNDANILTLGGRITGKKLALEIVKVWLNTSFTGGRHLDRIKKVHELEKEW
ncbi:MAG: ribose 5-phosphate isomerase B [Candidatus Firestonebacteria bacterium]